MELVNKVTTVDKGINWLAASFKNSRVFVYRDDKIFGKGEYRDGLIHGVMVSNAILGRLERKLAKVAA